MMLRLAVYVCLLLLAGGSATELTALAQEPALSNLSVTDVQNVINDKDWILVDTRATDTYNGWKLDGNERGGHLPGAVDFPASWLDSNHKNKNEILRAALRSKGIERKRHVVLYGKEPDRVRVARYLGEEGFERLYGFDLQQWTKEPGNRLVRYPNYQLLVPAVVVKQLLDGKKPETFEQATRVKIVEVSWGTEQASYSRGHIPGSFHVNTDHFEPPPSWKLGSPKVLEQFARQYGFQHDDSVIAYGEDPTASYRLAIVLRYMGVSDVRVLNGGLNAWKLAGFELETQSHSPPTADSFGAKIPKRGKLIDDTGRVKDRLRSPAEFTLVDTRNWAEFTGKTSGYKYHSVKGRIPGSVFGQANFRGSNSLSPYRNIDNTMRNASEIQQLWDASGIDSGTHLSFMCGGGWRAAEVLTFAQVIGLNNTSLYSDGWIGWSNDPTNPLEKGPIQSPVPEKNERMSPKTPSGGER